ncbi:MULTISPECIES: glycosyltransferase family 2 protein [Spirulina sp. CCY15215]|uniref:glycosyltransferase n=1 Tax=Spirulina sp. CCY15215 TaxID=2767591 RepID=UPI001951C318|nr:glycosyltransferase family 2 protein [Spirulina major]
MKLSLCTIVKDEEKSLPQCLDSVKGVVDEIVILDTGSSDRTPEIAAEYGAKVHYFTWNNDFAAARNEALKYVKGDWVLILDADERLNPDIVPHIKVAMLEERALVINLIRKEIGAAQSPYSLTSRLFRRHPKIEFSRPYHALIDDSVVELVKKEPHWQIATIPSIAVLHYGYDPHEIASKEKGDRAKTAMESYIKDHPNDSYACNKLGALYLEEKRIEEGIELLERGLKDMNAGAMVIYELNYHLANAYNRKQDVNKAVIYYQAALAQNILPALKLGSYNNLGTLLFTAGEYQMAERAFAASIVADPSFAFGYYNLGMTLKAQNNFDMAIKAYNKAIELKPDYAQAYQNLGVTWFKCGKVDLGLQNMGKAIALLEMQNLLEAQRLRQELKEMGFEVPKVKLESVTGKR